MTMEELRNAWAEFVEKLNGCPITTADVDAFCVAHATCYEEWMTMYELLIDEAEVEPEDGPDFTDDDWDECGFDPYEGCYTYDC